MSSLISMLSDNPPPARFAARYLAYVGGLLSRLNCDEIAAFMQVLLDARERSATIFFIGNGGSAATASHFANDLAIGTNTFSKPFRVVSLTDNVSVLTAIANDHGYTAVFTAQLKVLMQPDDVVVAISASGNSPNILDAVQWANQHGGVTVALTGFDGGQLRQLAHRSVHVPTPDKEYGPVEDVHMIFDHLVGTYLRAVCALEPAQKR
jgi:D-sedoheptulose 7-phosphate isomerase